MMKPARTHVRTALLAGILASAGSRAAHAQSREPLCTVVETRRLLDGRLLGGEGDRMVAEPLLRAGPAGERFVVAVRDPWHSLFAGDTARGPRNVSELGYGAPSGSGGNESGAHGQVASPPGIAIVRTDARMAPVGPALFVPDPTTGSNTAASSAPGLPVGVALPSGVLLLQRIRGDIVATLVGPSGDVPAPRRVLEAPSSPRADVLRGFTWLTATARGDGAVLLAGTAEGEVIALRFDRDGATSGAPVAWTQRVGGPMQLLPGSTGPLAALLARPVQGTGPNNEQAAQQVLVHLNDDTLVPAGGPFATGFAQFPMAYARRGESMVLVQWAQTQGVAISVLPVAGQRYGEQLPRVWYAQPPLEGIHAGQGALLGAGNIVYDVVAYTDPVGGALYGHVAWIPPSAAPIVRRDVLPARTRLVAGPRVLPAADGVVAILAGNDETGAGVDAFHVRCDLVALPTGGER